jgi:hypothetical protein
MGYEVTAQIKVNQADIVADEDELEAASLEATSFDEFVRTGLASLAVVVLASAALYLAVLAVVTLGMSGLQ